VSRAELLASNARIAGGSAASEALAFGTGGWLVQWLSAPLALLVDGITYVASAGLIAGVRSPESEPGPSRREAGLARIAAGARTIRSDARLTGLLALGMAAAVASESLGVVYFLFVRRELGFTPGVLGVLFAVGSLASVGASLVAGRVNDALGGRRAIGAGLLVGGIATLALAGAPGATWLGVAAIGLQQLGDAGLTIFEVQSLSQRQAAAPPELQGRVHGAFSFLGSWAMFGGALVGGVLGDAIGPRATIAGAAALQVAAALAWLAFAPRERPL
jgi:predicted MFS family arabinose efflux permease